MVFYYFARWVSLHLTFAIHLPHLFQFDLIFWNWWKKVFFFSCHRLRHASRTRSICTTLRLSSASGVVGGMNAALSVIDSDTCQRIYLIYMVYSTYVFSVRHTLISRLHSHSPASCFVTDDDKCVSSVKCLCKAAAAAAASHIIATFFEEIQIFM